MRTRTIAGGVGFLIALALVIAAVVKFASPPQAATQEGHDHAAMAPGGDESKPVQLSSGDQRRIGITFATAEQGSLTRNVRVVGVVAFDETRVRTVTARVDGYVERLDADFTGRLVRTGEPLLWLYSPMIEAAQQELLLSRELVHSLAAGDPEGRAAAERTVEGARQRLRLWNVSEATVAAAERTGSPVRQVPLHSPYPGFVIEKNVNQGQRVMVGDPLFRLADLSVVWVEGEVFEQDLPLVRRGARVLASFQALPGVERVGRLTYIYPTVDPTTRTAKIRVELANADLALKPGMYATIQFDGVAAQGVSVPRSAVLSTGARHLVFLKQGDGPFQPREVVIGVSTPERIQILRGLSPGDSVVASATFLLDAESNLGTLLGGMGDMPGMDVGPLKKPASPPARPDSRDHDDHGGHD